MISAAITGVRAAELGVPWAAWLHMSGPHGRPGNRQSEVDGWINRIRGGGGDQKAAAALVEHLYPTVSKILSSRLPQHVALEDVAQQVFLKVFSKIDQFRGDTPIEHWVSKIAVNTCLNAMRGQRQRLEIRRSDLSAAEDAVLDDLHIDTANSDVDRRVAGKELLQKLLECLSPKERLAVELTELEGYTSQEAAKILGSNAVAVRVRVTRARGKMRRHLEALQSEPSH